VSYGLSDIKNAIHNIVKYNHASQHCYGTAIDRVISIHISYKQKLGLRPGNSICILL